MTLTYAQIYAQKMKRYIARDKEGRFHRQVFMSEIRDLTNAIRLLVEMKSVWNNPLPKVAKMQAIENLLWSITEVWQTLQSHSERLPACRLGYSWSGRKEKDCDTIQFGYDSEYDDATINSLAAARIMSVLPYCMAGKCGKFATEDNYCPKHSERMKLYGNPNRDRPISLDGGKEIALARANHKCEKCGETRILHVHHIQARRNNNSPLIHHPDNLMVLCPTCHALAHRNKRRRKKREEAIV